MDYMSIISIVGMLAIFYFLLIRPQQKQAKATKELRSGLQVGDKVTTIGGITGKIVNIKDDNITIENGADRTKLSFARWAIGTKEALESDDEK